MTSVKKQKCVFAVWLIFIRLLFYEVFLVQSELQIYIYVFLKSYDHYGYM